MKRLRIKLSSNAGVAETTIALDGEGALVEIGTAPSAGLMLPRAQFAGVRRHHAAIVIDAGGTITWNEDLTPICELRLGEQTVQLGAQAVQLTLSHVTENLDPQGRRVFRAEV